MATRPTRDARTHCADHRRRTHVPMPAVEEIEQELRRQLTPATFAQARRAHSHLNLRDRKLNLPAMCAIVLSLVWRQIASLRELLRVLEQEGLLWVEAMDVSLEALSKRFEKLPAALFATLFEELVTASQQRRTAGNASSTQRWRTLASIYECIWIADASTLEQVRKTTHELRQQSGIVLGGKLLMVVEAVTHLPVRAFFERDAMANEKRFTDRIVAALPAGGLIILDAGFFSFALFDTLSDAGKFFLTRMRAKTAYEGVTLLSQGTHYRDEIIEVGLHSGYPCRHRLRMVSVLWGRSWYRYLSNELDPQRLSPQQIATLYRERWRIEDAFLLSKRLLGLSYLWVGSHNGIEMQIYATLIFYSVLVELCHDLADVGVEIVCEFIMIFRVSTAAND